MAELLLGAARQQGVSLLIATHDSRLKSRFREQLALPRAAPRLPHEHLLQLAWSYLRARPLGTLLNVLLLALGVGTIGFVRHRRRAGGDSLTATPGASISSSAPREARCS